MVGHENRNGAVAIVDEKGRERGRYAVVYGLASRWPTAPR